MAKQVKSYRMVRKETRYAYTTVKATSLAEARRIARPTHSTDHTYTKWALIGQPQPLFDPKDSQ
ncbi:MAG: hypothetical protein ABFE08_05410 [Armatimonadia bacterium]